MYSKSERLYMKKHEPLGWPFPVLRADDTRATRAIRPGGPCHVPRRSARHIYAAPRLMMMTTRAADSAMFVASKSADDVDDADEGADNGNDDGNDDGSGGGAPAAPFIAHAHADSKDWPSTTLF